VSLKRCTGRTSKVESKQGAIGPVKKAQNSTPCGPPSLKADFLLSPALANYHGSGLGGRNRGQRVEPRYFNNYRLEAGSFEARRVQWHELDDEQTHRLFMATDPTLHSRCVFAYESKPRQPHTIWSLARITSSSAALSGGFWKKATAPDSRERRLLSRFQPVRTITGITESAG
jgi:hypothetical protein